MVENKEDPAEATRVELERALVEREEAERARAAVEARFLEMCDRSPVSIFRTTRNGRILYANEAGVRMLGYPSRAELLATPVLELYAHPAQRDEMLAQLEQKGSIANREMALRRRDGAPVQSSSKVEPGSNLWG